MVAVIPRHPLHRLALRGDHRPAGAPRSFRRSVARGIRLRGQTAGRARRGRAASVSSGSPEGWPGPDHGPAHLQHRGVHDAGRGHAPQPGIDREHPRGHSPGLAARRARRDADPHGRTGDPPPVEPTAARRNGAQPAPRRADRLARRGARTRRAAPDPPRPRRPRTVDQSLRPGHRPPARSRWDSGGVGAGGADPD